MPNSEVVVITGASRGCGTRSMPVPPAYDARAHSHSPQRSATRHRRSVLGLFAGAAAGGAAIAVSAR